MKLIQVAKYGLMALVVAFLAACSGTGAGSGGGGSSSSDGSSSSSTSKHRLIFSLERVTNFSDWQDFQCGIRAAGATQSLGYHDFNPQADGKTLKVAFDLPNSDMEIWLNSQVKNIWSPASDSFDCSRYTKVDGWIEDGDGKIVANLDLSKLTALPINGSVRNAYLKLVRSTWTCVSMNGDSGTTTTNGTTTIDTGNTGGSLSVNMNWGKTAARVLSSADITSYLDYVRQQTDIMELLLCNPSAPCSDTVNLNRYLIPRTVDGQLVNEVVIKGIPAGSLEVEATAIVNPGWSKAAVGSDLVTIAAGTTAQANLNMGLASNVALTYAMVNARSGTFVAGKNYPVSVDGTWGNNQPGHWEGQGQWHLAGWKVTDLVPLVQDSLVFDISPEVSFDSPVTIRVMGENGVLIIVSNYPTGGFLTALGNISIIDLANGQSANGGLEIHVNF